MPWHWYDEDEGQADPSRTFSLYQNPYERPRVRSFADDLPDWMLRGPGPGVSRGLMESPDFGPPAADKYSRMGTLLGLTAQAFAPESFGGRLGRSAAGLGIHEADQAYRERLERERWRQAALRGLMTRRMGDLPPGYTRPPENRDPNEPYTAPWTPRQRMLAINPGQEVVGETDPGRYGLLYGSQRTPSQMAPPATAPGHYRPAYEGYPAVVAPLVPAQMAKAYPGQSIVGPVTPEGEYGPLYEPRRTPAQQAPPATPLGSSRPAYGDFPAVEGRFSPRQSVAPLPPGHAAYSPETGGADYVAPWTPRQMQLRSLMPGATQQGSLPAPGETFTAPMIPRQTVIPVAPGATPYSGITGQPIGPQAAQTARQAAAEERRGLMQVAPEGTVIDKTGKIIFKAPPRSGVAKAAVSQERLALQTESETLAKLDRALADALKAELDEMQKEILRTRRVGVQKRLQQISRQLGQLSLQGERGSTPIPSTPTRSPQSSDPLEGRTATGPGGKKLIRRNGQWVPYAP